MGEKPPFTKIPLWLSVVKAADNIKLREEENDKLCSVLPRKLDGVIEIN